MQNSDKISELEIKITYLEDYIEQINSVVIEQAEKISFLQKSYEQLKMQVQTKTEDIRPDEKPPHY